MTPLDRNELAHYGVLGMKWGIRRTPEQLGHHKIKKGTKVYRSTSNPNEKESGSTYVTYLPPDRDRYKGGFLTMKMGKGDRFFESEYVLKEDLSVPSRKELQEVIDKIYKEKGAKIARNVGKARAEYAVKALKDRGADFSEKELKEIKKKYVDDFLKHYKDFTTDELFVATTTVFNQKPDIFNDVVGELKKRGYNAMVDEHGVGGQGGVARKGVDPLIVFDREKTLEKRSSKIITPAESSISAKKYDKWYITANKRSNRDKPW